MDLDREAAIDFTVAAIMALYGIFVMDDDPAMGSAAWLVAILLILKHVVEPINNFAEKRRSIFLLILFSILVAGLIHSA